MRIPNINTVPCVNQELPARLKFADRQTDTHTNRGTALNQYAIQSFNPEAEV